MLLVACSTAISISVGQTTDTKSNVKLQPLPTPVTSFGAAIIDNALYMYGGHAGGAHSYSKEEQSNELTKLDLSTGEWSTIAEGPHLQGLAMVAHRGKLYRIGGFTALNAEGEEHDLKSQDTVACFDVASKVWKELPPLPEPRSSHDAAVVGDAIYVAGGWMLADGETTWHTTAWKLDLAAEALSWKPIASPPFQRRALALAAHDHRLYVVGGMQSGRGPTTAVAVYDAGNDTWTDGPALFVSKPSKASSGGTGRDRGMASGNMAGFGASAFATGGSLYASTVQGVLQRLSADGKQWDVVATNIEPRFFHRLLALDATTLLVTGGANMSSGKFDEVEILNVGLGSE